MPPPAAPKPAKDRRKIPSRKNPAAAQRLDGWADRYLDAAVTGVRSAEVEAKIRLHLDRFRTWYTDSYGQERIDTIGRREITSWRNHLATKLAPSTVNAHVASLVGFFTWVAAHGPAALPGGNPTVAVASMPLPPLEPRAFSPAQVRTLKNVTDRLERFHTLTGRRRVGDTVHRHARPRRDRAIVYTLLSTGLRRSELVAVDLDQLEPSDPGKLRRAKRARLAGVTGKGRTQRTVFLSADARQAIADYLDTERPADAAPGSTALFLAARSVASRRPDGRLSPRAVNLILERLGHWHDGEHHDPERRLGQLRPHTLRHTFAFALAEATGADPYELQRRLGHRSQRYIARYTNPPEAIAAGYIEQL